MCPSNDIKLEDYVRLIIKLSMPYAIREKCDVRDSEAFSVALLVFTEILPRYDPKRGTFATFLYLAVSQKLWKLNRNRIPTSTWPEATEEVAQPDAIEKLYGQDLIDKLRSCLSYFAANSREHTILEMRLDGYTYAEIAAVIGHSRANAEGLFRRNIWPVLVQAFEQEMLEDASG